MDKQMPISMIVAVSENGVIGNNGKIPWYLPRELQEFKRRTLGSSIIMGRRTAESLPKVLPGRESIIITRSNDYRRDGYLISHSIEAAIKLASNKQVFIIGGAEIYRQAINLVTTVYMTTVHGYFEGDAFFSLSREWHKIVETIYYPDDKNKYPFTCAVLMRSDHDNRT